MTDVNLWDHEEPITALGIQVPAWIDQDISPATVAAIIQGGCESGAYMPAVTYATAMETMAEHGDEIIQSLEDAMGEPVEQTITSWPLLATRLVSTAVEDWALGVTGEIIEALEELEDEA